MIKYRRDIDGLRAMAVTSVILYHAFPKGIKGGFVGVDIFFVISGYLISSILLKMLDTNNFNIYDFYAKRIKRIFPALILVLLSSLVFGWFTLTSAEYMHIAKHAKASTLFYTNFTLAKEAGYFDVTANAKPLLHLWSLAIEEQFYIFWPLLLWVSRKKGLNLSSICIAIILISFIANIKITHKHPVDAFYFPWCRAWELISGALLACLNKEKSEFIEKVKLRLNHWLNIIIYKDHLSSKNTLNHTVSIIGFTINLACVFFLKKTSSFPGWYASLPVLGTMLIIAAGEQGWANNKILSNKLCVGIGLISYPLYLWHWSLLSFAYILEGDALGTKEILITLAFSIFLAWLTYRFVEIPIRSSKNKKFLVIILSLALSITGISAYQICRNKGYQGRKADIVGMPQSPQDTDTLMNLQIDCLSLKPIEKEFRNLFCTTNSSKPQFAIMGDSHALAFGYGFISKDMKAVMVSRAGTIPFMNYINYNPLHRTVDKNLESSPMQIQFFNKIIETYDSLKYIILTSRGPLYFSGTGFGLQEQEMNGFIIKHMNNLTLLTSAEAFVEGYVETINYLIAKGKKVVFVIDIPELGIDPKACVNRPISIFRKEVASCLLDRKIVDERQKEYRVLVEKIKKRVPSLLVYDASSLFCDDDKCYGKIGNTVIYGDDDHLNIEGAKILINDFQQWLEKQDHLGSK